MNMKKLRRLIVKQFRAEHGEEENSKKECKRKFKEIISSERDLNLRVTMSCL